MVEQSTGSSKVNTNDNARPIKVLAKKAPGHIYPQGSDGFVTDVFKPEVQLPVW